jgi:hypothetical protein
MSRWSAYRWSTHAPGLGAFVAFAIVACAGVLFAGPAAASVGTPGMVVKVTPNHGLVNGRTVTISGHGLTRSDGDGSLTWFATECTASVRGRMNPSTDTPHCDVTDAQAVRVSRNGSFSTKFRVRSGIVGDGYCGTAGHTTCVIGIGTVKGQGTVVRISFATPPSPTTTTTSTTTTTGR